MHFHGSRMAIPTAHSICRQRSTRGFSLTELAIVLGVIGLVLGGIWVAASSVHRNNQLQKANQEISLILAGYRSTYAMRGIDVAAATDVTCNGVTNNYFPQDMIAGGCSTGTTSTYPVNPWNGYVQVMAGSREQGRHPDRLLQSHASGLRYLCPAGPAARRKSCWKA